MAKEFKMQMNLASRLDKYSLKTHQLMVKSKFTLKAMEYGASHTMLRNLMKYGVELDGVFNSVGDFCFSKTTLPLEEYSLDMDVQFDAVTLNARLMSISISSKRVKDGNTETEYSFNFEKDADKEDFDLVIPYFKVKEPDEEGDSNKVDMGGIQDLVSELEGGGKGKFKRKKKRPFIYYDTYFTIE
ncbi:MULTISPECIES: hypothetical protein [unclassified Fibrobacter]|uniref:hypothetical protein n=1 Tax=unclassified Fibrobacter TaxID=2634177 RepID=UPI000C70474B|nr:MULTISPECIES: hypothetical protein [unclassified Fibrobacter]PWJ61035.1 hypothetical protein BGX12_13111 [Fibrobacter sp. UWR4]PZW68056.1 hypothetical protein C8E88_102132 [Fibrobacter sp. UWR1]